jgi:molecular chaperone IbpA
MNKNYFDNLDKLINGTFGLPDLDNCKYPPYNIIGLDDNTQLLEFAVAGFGAEDLSVTVDENVLVLSGNLSQHAEADELSLEPNYIRHGIASRAFTNKFRLTKYTVVKETTLKNGILSILLEVKTPEETQPIKVNINVQ